MKIGIDARKLRDGGIGTYVRETLRACARAPRDHRFVALVDPDDAGRSSWPGGAVEEVTVRAGKYSPAEHWIVPGASRRAGVTLLHEPHYTLPLGWTGPSVVTIHDLIHVRLAHLFPPGAGLYARAVAGLAVRRARRVIANSEHTKGELIELLGAPAERIAVIPLGVAPAFHRRDAGEVAAFRRERGLPAEYVLYVGARKAHKNLPLLLRACARLADHPALVLSGPAWSPEDPLAALARELGLEDRIRFAGALPDDDALARLYSGAAAYVQPSLLEGFGLPPLEALACGVPVVAARTGALPEVLGDAATLLDPVAPEAWAAAIDAARGTDAEARAHGVAHARRFDWDRAGARTLDVYEQAAR